MSKKVPVTSSGGLQLKDLYISCTIDKSRHSHESEGLKPKWFSQDKLFPLRNSNIEILLNIFPLSCQEFFLSSFLWTGTLLGIFGLLGVYSSTSSLRVYSSTSN